MISGSSPLKSGGAPETIVTNFPHIAQWLNACSYLKMLVWMCKLNTSEYSECRTARRCSGSSARSGSTRASCWGSRRRPGGWQLCSGLDHFKWKWTTIIFIKTTEQNDQKLGSKFKVGGRQNVHKKICSSILGLRLTIFLHNCAGGGLAWNWQNSQIQWARKDS